MAPTLGGVHKIQILIRDLLKEFLQKIFGEEMGGSGGPRPPYSIRCTADGKKKSPLIGAEKEINKLKGFKT